VTELDAKLVLFSNKVVNIRDPKNLVISSVPAIMATVGVCEKRQIPPEFRAYQKIYLNFEYSKITTIKVG